MARQVEGALINQRVIEELTPPLLNLARRMLVRPEDAEDAVQEMWISALRSAERFEGRSSLRAWLTGILRKRIYDRYHKDRRLDALLHEVASEPESGASAVDLKAAASLVERALAEMREVERTAIRLCDIDELDRDEAAERLGVSRVHLRVLLFRVRQKLEALLERQGMGAEILC